MKKISNNVLLGLIIQVLNVAVLVFVIISVVFLLKFDKINVQKVKEEPKYSKEKEYLHTVEHPLKHNQAEVDYYVFKLDTMAQHRDAIANDKKAVKAVKALNEDIERNEKILAEKKEALKQTQQAIADEMSVFTPIETEYNKLVEDNNKAKDTFMTYFWLTLCLFVLKIIVWALWTYKNSKNLRNICPWMMKATHPVWAFLGWIVPVYNLIKPYTFFNEIYDETEYALNDKGIIPENSKGDNDFVTGFWWGLFICTVVIVSGVLYLTFFTESQILSISNDTIYLTGGSFVKLPAGFSGDYNDLVNLPIIPTQFTFFHQPKK